jgi:hypothetical protein
MTMVNAGRAAIAALLMMLVGLPSVSQAGPRTKAEPRIGQTGRFTVVADRVGGRVPEIARRLAAQDLFLAGWLAVPAEQLSQPVTLLYLHRSHGMERKLPFRGDRIGHEHLVPTDTRLWVLVREDTGLEDLRPATVQVAEYGLLRTAGTLPPWLRSGMTELLARLSLEEGRLELMAASFPALHAAGVSRAPLEAVAEPGWNRYHEPLRWYTSALVVAYLFDEDSAALARALADPGRFDLTTEVDRAHFEAWIEEAVVPDSVAPRLLHEGVEPDLTVLDHDEDRRQTMLVDLSLVHSRGAKAFQLASVTPSAAAQVRVALADAEIDLPCGALWDRGAPEERYLLGLCLAGHAPHTAEEILRQLARADPGQPRAALQAATLVLSGDDRLGEAAVLVEDALRAAPADADAQLLWAVIRARGGSCTGWLDHDPRRLEPPWDALSTATGPLERARDGFVREVLECGAGSVE